MTPEMTLLDFLTRKMEEEMKYFQAGFFIQEIRHKKVKGIQQQNQMRVFIFVFIKVTLHF